jgi:hypothetical protein
MTEWVSVSESLPPYERRVLVSLVHKNYPKNDHVGLARRVKTDGRGEWWQNDIDATLFQGVTFWHELPRSPRLPDSAGEKP